MENNIRSHNVAYPCTPRLMPGRILLALLFCLLVTPASAEKAPAVNASTAIAEAGNYRVSWQTETDHTLFQIEESTSSTFKPSRIIYQGEDSASIVSGRSNGNYFYRARILDKQLEPASDWSEPVRITVEHHSLQRAFTFFAIGLVVFIATLLVIIRGSRHFSD